MKMHITQLPFTTFSFQKNNFTAHV